jgi:hypothetical protein
MCASNCVPCGSHAYVAAVTVSAKDASLVSAPSSALPRHLTLPTCSPRSIGSEAMSTALCTAKLGVESTPTATRSPCSTCAAALCAKLSVDVSPYVANTLTTFYTRSRNVDGALATVRYAPTCRLAAVGRPYRRSPTTLTSRAISCRTHF